ncbi:MAG TPA: hypothetical protein VGP07_21930 [Polyangia bacterium]|jgi:hypothetical protein
MSKNALSHRLLTSLLAILVPVAGLASPSCASPRLPTGGYPLRANSGGYELQVLLDGVPVQTFEHAGENFVMGQMGARYTLRVINHTRRRIEAVVSVDGRDAIDGKSADVRMKRGYLVPAWGTVDVDGWRLSTAEVAAFRFATVADSYAARTGSARDVGVIGVAVFPERFVEPRPVYAPPPRLPDWRYRDDGLGSAAPPAGADKEEYAERSAPSHAAKSSAGTGRASAEPMAAPASPPRDSLADEAGAPAPQRRPGLGTEFGEAVNSPVREVSFMRANASRPAVVLGVRYNDREGLVALGIDVEACCAPPEDLAWRQTATPFPASDRHYAAPPAGWREGCCVRY